MAADFCRVEQEGREPDFADLKRFIVKEADVVKSYANSFNFESKPGSVFGVNTHYTVASNSTKAINTYECKFCRSLKHRVFGNFCGGTFAFYAPAPPV